MCVATVTLPDVTMCKIGILKQELFIHNWHNSLRSKGPKHSYLMYCWGILLWVLTLMPNTYHAYGCFQYWVAITYLSNTYNLQPSIYIRNSNRWGIVVHVIVQYAAECAGDLSWSYLVSIALSFPCRHWCVFDVLGEIKKANKVSLFTA